MTLDQIDRLVRQANPVPDLKLLEPVETPVLTKQRRMDMQTHDRVVIEKRPERPRQGLLIGIAAAAAVVIGALLLLPLGDEAPVADQPAATPVEVATAFLEAFWSFDIDLAASYLAPDADLSAFEWDGATWQMANRLMQAQAWKVSLDSCEATGVTLITVTCPFAGHTLRSDEIGLGPFGGNSFAVGVQDGLIVSVDMRLDDLRNGFDSQVWGPFTDWIRANHPEDGPVMFSDWPTAHIERLSEESIVLWEQRSRGYVEMVNGQAVDTATAFVQAFGSFDVEGVADLLAPQANLSSFEWDGEDWLASNRLQEAQGFKLLLNSCDLVGVSSSSTIVSCPFDFHSLRSDEVGLGPFTGSSFDVSLEDGMVSRASINLNIDEFGVQMWQPFGEWLAETYPDDVAVMYTNSGQSLERLNEESIALWEQRTREYVTVVGG